MRFAWILALTLGACAKSEAPAGRPARGELRFSVEVAEAEARRVEYKVTAVGSIEAFERVQVAARVAGAVEEVRFAEGDVVKKGQVLAAIEPERYRLMRDVAQAAYTRAEAGLREAESNFKRREALVREKPDLIPQEELQTFRTRLEMARAELMQATAQLKAAELNLRDAYPAALAAGIIETRTVETGQYVSPGTLLTTLIRREPLLVRFKVPEGQGAALAVGMQVQASVQHEAEPYAARITHVGGVADSKSRMVSVTAEVDDRRKASLRPGAFAEVVVPVGGAEDALVVPELAVRPSERGFVAYVVEGEVARVRVLTVGLRTGDGMVEIRGGLEPGEQVVVRGAEALSDGVKVRVANPKAEALKAPEAAPLAPAVAP